ncbi:hypothetical protein [Thiosocius teredinicola]|uniref:hypothetical protein n=1 Tax=Thiosocius teredinicola TaxID=1973002 RepID=UPI00099125FC
MRRFFNPLLSLFTVVGGHVLNRRLDLALLFFTALLLLSVGSFYFVPLFLWGSDAGAILSAGPSLRTMAYALLAVLAVFILTSVVVSFVGARRAAERPALSKAGVVGGMLASLISIPLTFWIGVADLSYLELSTWQPAGGFDDVEADDSGERVRTYSFSSRFFHQTVRFGGEWVSAADLEDLPAGDAYLSGRILFNERPAAGVSLMLIIGSKYVSALLITDDDGLFSVSVPPGEWVLNRIEIEGWSERPADGEFSVVGGPNPPLTERQFTEGPSFQSEGLTVVATARPVPLPELQLAIRPNVQVTSPAGERESADGAQHTIAWESFESASRYQLQLMQVTRDGSSTIYSPVAWVNTDAQQVPLTDFEIVDDGAGDDHEYAVQVFAFDSSGKLLSDSGGASRRTSLLLKGKRIVETETLLALGNYADLTRANMEEELELRYRDNKRLSAARTLLDDGLVDAARTLLERVEASSLEEERLTVSGMILASEGRCDEAKEELDRANSLRGTTCYPQIYSERCATQ